MKKKVKYILWRLIEGESAIAIVYLVLPFIVHGRETPFDFKLMFLIPPLTFLIVLPIIIYEHRKENKK